MNPIIDKCDYVVYLKSNGVDSEGRVIKSSAYLAQTDQFFARARIDHTPTFIKEFTAENLTAAIQEGINKKKSLDNATITTFEEQQKLNKIEELDFDSLVKRFNDIILSIPGSNDINCTTPEGETFKTFWYPNICQITETYLGKGGKVSQCNKNQVEAISLIIKDLEDFISNNLNN